MQEGKGKGKKKVSKKPSTPAAYLQSLRVTPYLPPPLGKKPVRLNVKGAMPKPAQKKPVNGGKKGGKK